MLLNFHYTKQHHWHVQIFLDKVLTLKIFTNTFYFNKFLLDNHLARKGYKVGVKKEKI